eukprot:485549-Prymnesium_polylepis.1
MKRDGMNEGSMLWGGGAKRRASFWKVEERRAPGPWLRRESSAAKALPQLSGLIWPPRRGCWR